MIYRNNGYGFIDRFCAKHPRFGIPNLMKLIVFGQLAVYVLGLLGEMLFQYNFVNFLTFVPAQIFRGQVWRLVSWLVVPYDISNPFYLLLGCYFYYWIAAMLEREWGTAKFTLFYLSGAVLSVVIGLVIGLILNAGSLKLLTVLSMDLSHYLNLSIFLVLAVLFGEMQVYLFFVVPVKLKWMALIDVVLVAVDVVRLITGRAWPLALVPLASFVNFFVFTWPFWRAKIGMTRYQHDPKVVNFKKAQKKAQETRGYHHKCAVCGITDADDPNMEFRYCSKCDGYYCYCAKHINNHVHIHHD